MSNFINRRFKNFKFINEKYKPEIIEKLLNSQNKSIKFYTKLKHVAEWFLYVREREREQERERESE